MASCTTPTFGNANTCPRVTLEVNITTDAASSVILSWALKYYAGSAPQTSVNKNYTAVIAGQTVASGSYDIDGKTGTHVIKSGTKTINKSTSPQNISFSCSMGFNLTWSGTYGGTKSASGNISVPAKTKYTVSYNANGGSGAPGAQTKWAGTNITISATKPTRTGYTFAGWATSSSGAVKYQPGATYSDNASVTLYAIWSSVTYTVSYNANGGSGAPGAQTKAHGVDLILSSTKPTRTNYTFKGWGTSPESSTVSYAAGDTYTSNAPITLYAVWGISYTKPRITDFSVDRCDSGGNSKESGTFAKILFSWNTDKPVSSIKIEYKQEQESTWTAVSVSASGTYGSVTRVIGGSLLTDYAYNIRVTVTDSVGSSDATRTVGGMEYTVDFLKGGKGIAFGKPASKEHCVDTAWGIMSTDDESITRISRNGISESWHAGRDSAILKQHSLDGYSCMSSIKTSNGSWDMGTSDDSMCQDDLLFTYISDDDYDANANRANAQISFRNDGNIRTREGENEWEHVIQTRYIPVGTDLNTIIIPGVYYGTIGSYANIPAARYASSFTLEVYLSGNTGQILQRLTRCHKSESMTFERMYYEGTFGSWAAIYGKTKILWSGGYFMTAGHIATLSQKISEQRSGVIVVFSPYIDDAIKNYDRNAFFVPKEVVTRHNGGSMMFTSTASMPGNIVANKCITIYDDRMVGHADNNYVGNVSGSNIYIQNNKFVLQYIIGV